MNPRPVRRPVPYPARRPARRPVGPKTSLAALAGAAGAALAALLLPAPAARAQLQGWTFYGGAYTESSAIGAAGRRIYAIDRTTGAETVALNLDNYSLFTGQTIFGTNGLAYDLTSNRLYFALSTASVSTAQPGSGGVYYWDRDDNSVGTLLSSFGGFGDDTTVNADNAAVYNGHYYFVQDQTEDSGPNLYRISLTAANPVVERFDDFNGGSSARSYYDFGDIAIDAGGVLRGSARSRNTTNGTLFNMFFTANIGSSGFTVAGYAETTSQTTVTAVYQPTYGWNNNGTALGTQLYAQNSGGSAGSGTGQFVQLNGANGSEVAVLFDNNGQRIYSDLTSAPFQPVPATSTQVGLMIGASMGLLRFGAAARRGRRRWGGRGTSDESTAASAGTGVSASA